jgi:ABC-type multidrug transport system ATPase subunit
MSNSIEISSLTKVYDNTKALNDINLHIKKNELFGLIGPDGAGKTTLIRIIATLLLPDSGTITVENLDVVKDYKSLRKIYGYMPGRFSLYQDLTVIENLNFFATVFGTTVDENYDLIKDIYSQIEPFKNRRAGQLSGGMKQKLALSCALIHKPKVLLLDEPTTGVDAVSRKEFWEMLKNLQKNDITIFVSTPYMDEASLCDRIALIQKGKILSVETPENITKQFGKQLLQINSDNKYKVLKDLRNYEFTNSVNSFGQFLHYTDKRSVPEVQSIKNYLNEKGNSNINIKEIMPNIEDCFMDLMIEDKN